MVEAAIAHAEEAGPSTPEQRDRPLTPDTVVSRRMFHRPSSPVPFDEKVRRVLGVWLENPAHVEEASPAFWHAYFVRERAETEAWFDVMFGSYCNPDFFV